MEVLKMGKSPCKGCKRVPDPASCDNKLCKPWRKWFLMRWALIHGYGKKEGLQ